MAAEKVLVTGGLGTLGKPLVEELSRRGHDVWILDKAGANREKHLRCDVSEFRQLQYALQGRDFEVIVVDDGSTDETSQILSQYGDRIRVIRQSNRGGAAALNRGIHAARGEWIAWLSADDAWEPAKLEKQVQGIRQNPNVGIVYTDYLYVNAQSETLVGRTLPAATDATADVA